MGAVPEVVALGRAGVSPDACGFGAVVSPAQAGEGVGVGLAGWAAFVDREVGDGVVFVAVLGGDGATGEDAVAVAELDELFHPCGWVVLVDGVAAGHVQDG